MKHSKKCLNGGECNCTIELELLRKTNEYSEKEEKVAKFLEDMTRKDDEERKLYPSLKRYPKEENTWKGWTHAARCLIKLLDE